MLACTSTRKIPTRNSHFTRALCILVNSLHSRTLCSLGCKPIVPVESVHFECLSGLSARHVSTPNGYPQTGKIYGSLKFISFILSDVEKFATFNGENILQIRSKWLKYRQETPCIGGSCHTNTTLIIIVRHMTQYIAMAVLSVYMFTRYCHFKFFYTIIVEGVYCKLL